MWILGVQRELNELKRTLQMIPAGIKKPKPEDVSTLELGQFWACWGRHALKVYVQPAWMADPDAHRVAIGGPHPVPPPGHDPVVQQVNRAAAARMFDELGQDEEDQVNAAEAERIRAKSQQLALDNDALRRENDDLRRRLSRLEAAADDP